MKEISRRMVRAHIHLEAVLGRRVDLDELAERTARAHGEKSFSQSKLSGYRTGAVNPSVDVLAAYAKATGVDPGWLAFGVASGAPAPEGITAEPVRRVAEHPPTGVARLGGKEVPERTPHRRKRAGG
jgi:transcriptional regulator with XRE-family HTH domain